LKSGVDTPRLDFVLTTACVLLTAHLSDTSPRIDVEAHILLLHVLRIIRALGSPTRDPEIAPSCVDVISRLIPRYVSVLLSVEGQDDLWTIFGFTLDCLKGDDMLPKRSAASFWASFVILTDQPEPIQSSIKNIMEHVGPLLAAALIHNIGGAGARSELDTIAEPLKKMVFKQPKAKAWLEAALFSGTFPSQKVDAKEKKIWLQKVMNLRGAKATNQLVKEFWIACRGTNFAYVS